MYTVKAITDHDRCTITPLFPQKAIPIAVTGTTFHLLYLSETMTFFRHKIA